MKSDKKTVSFRCEQVRELIDGILKETVDDVMLGRVLAHHASCEACWEEFSEHAETFAKALPPPEIIPPVPNVHAALRELELFGELIPVLPDADNRHEQNVAARLLSASFSPRRFMNGLDLAEFIRNLLEKLLYFEQELAIQTSSAHGELQTREAILLDARYSELGDTVSLKVMNSPAVRTDGCLVAYFTSREMQYDGCQTILTVRHPEVSKQRFSLCGILCSTPTEPDILSCRIYQKIMDEPVFPEILSDYERQNVGNKAGSRDDEHSVVLELPSMCWDIAVIQRS